MAQAITEAIKSHIVQKVWTKKQSYIPFLYATPSYLYK